jgi:putative membrane protein
MDGIPFCGAPPLPGGTSWNLDPLLLTVLLLGTAATLVLGRRERGGAMLPFGGWVVLAVALVSPLCSLSVALFSVRVSQHMLVLLGAAPLLAIGVARLRGLAGAGTVLPGAIFAVLLWFWHLPMPYEASFAQDGIAWWMMHLSLTAGAVWLWAAVFAQFGARPHAAALTGIATAIQMGLLGAVLTFVPRPLYAPHTAGVTAPWGLTPLEDQQLGGLVMWVPGGLLFAVVMVVALAGVFAPRGRTAPLG